MNHAHIKLEYCLLSASHSQVQSSAATWFSIWVIVFFSWAVAYEEYCNQDHDGHLSASDLRRLHKTETFLKPHFASRFIALVMDKHVAAARNLHARRRKTIKFTPVMPRFREHKVKDRKEVKPLQILPFRHPADEAWQCGKNHPISRARPLTPIFIDFRGLSPRPCHQLFRGLSPRKLQKYAIKTPFLRAFAATPSSSKEDSRLPSGECRREALSRFQYQLIQSKSQIDHSFVFSPFFLIQ